MAAERPGPGDGADPTATSSPNVDPAAVRPFSPGADAGASDSADPSAGWRLPSTPPGRRRVRRRRRVPRWRLLVVGAVAVASAVGVVAAGLEPTGGRAADVAWSVVLAVAVVVAGSRARRWALLACSGLAAASASSWLLFVVGFAALALAILDVVLDRRDRVVGAVIAGASLQCLVRIDDWSWAPFGTSAVVAGLAVAVVIGSGWSNSRRRWRRRTLTAALVVSGIGMLFAVGLGVAAVASYGALGDGVREARAGVEATRDDERVAAARFREASEQLDDALGWVDSPLLAGVRTVPLLAQQQRAVVVAATSTRDLAVTAATGASVVEDDGLRPVDGSVDLVAVEALVPPLRAATQTLAVASTDLAAVDSPWLVPFIAERLGELRTTVDDTLPTSQLALAGAEVVPGMLGADGPRTWLVLVSTPAESRLNGGFVGNWAVVEASDGRLAVVEDGSAADLNAQVPPDAPPLDLPTDYLLRYGRYTPNRYFQNVTASPDFPTVGALAAASYRRATGRSVDGVISLDPVALGAIVDLGGPVRIGALDRTFTGAELAQYLLTDFYLLDEDAQDAVIADAIDAAVDGLTDGALPGPGVIAESLGGVVAEGRLQLWSPVPAEQAFFADLGADGALPPNTGQDFLFVGVANVAPNKIDTYLGRDVTYSAQWDETTGQVTAVAEVVLTNDAPAGLPPVVVGNSSGLPEGTARAYVSMYTPLQATSFSVDGELTGVEPQREGGWRTWSAQVLVPAGGAVVLRWELEGAVEPGEYRFSWRPQPLVIPPVLNLEVVVAGESSAAISREGPAPEAFEERLVPAG